MSILIADSGSTKTDWALINNNQSVIRFQTVGFNPTFQNEQQISEALKKELVPQLKSTSKLITQVHFYGAGCSSTEKTNMVKSALQVTFSNSTIHVKHDMLGAAIAACQNKIGIACILGTGSNACLYDGKNVCEELESLGYFFGDEGSGADIGKAFIYAYLKNKMPQHIKIQFENEGYNIKNILHHIYKEPYPNRYLAKICKFIIKYKEDEYIIQIISNCFESFINEQVSKITNSKKYQINFVGSIAFHFQTSLKLVFQKKHYTLGAIIQSPIEGLIKYHQLCL